MRFTLNHAFLVRTETATLQHFGSSGSGRLLPVVTGCKWPIAAGHDRQLSANSCL
jgi:hypothetical protein